MMGASRMGWKQVAWDGNKSHGTGAKSHVCTCRISHLSHGAMPLGVGP